MNAINYIKQINVDVELDYYIQIKHIIDEAMSNRKMLSQAMYAVIAYCNEAMLDYEHKITQFVGNVDDNKC